MRERQEKGSGRIWDLQGAEDGAELRKEVGMLEAEGITPKGGMTLWRGSRASVPRAGNGRAIKARNCLLNEKGKLEQHRRKRTKASPTSTWRGLKKVLHPQKVRASLGCAHCWD